VEVGGLEEENHIDTALKKLVVQCWVWWLMLVILATWESKNERITPGGQPGQIVLKIPSPK
jgi:hypothetical protein